MEIKVSGQTMEKKDLRQTMETEGFQTVRKMSWGFWFTRQNVDSYVTVSKELTELCKSPVELERVP